MLRLRSKMAGHRALSLDFSIMKTLNMSGEGWHMPARSRVVRTSGRRCQLGFMCWRNTPQWTRSLSFAPSAITRHSSRPSLRSIQWTSPCTRKSKLAGNQTNWTRISFGRIRRLVRSSLEWICNQASTARRSGGNGNWTWFPKSTNHLNKLYKSLPHFRLHPLNMLQLNKTLQLSILSKSFPSSLLPHFRLHPLNMLQLNKILQLSTPSK